MGAAGKSAGSHADIPWTKVAPWSAPGPSGEGQEHLITGVEKRLYGDAQTTGRARHYLNTIGGDTRSRGSLQLPSDGLHQLR